MIDRYEKRGRPAAGAKPTGSCWFIVGSLSKDEEAIERVRKRKEMFIIATNEPDRRKFSIVLPGDKILLLHPPEFHRRPNRVCL